MADAGDRVIRYQPLDLIRCYEKHDLHADGCTVIAIDLRTFEPNPNASTVLRSYLMTTQQVFDRFGITA